MFSPACIFDHSLHMYIRCLPLSQRLEYIPSMSLFLLIIIVRDTIALLQCFSFHYSCALPYARQFYQSLCLISCSASFHKGESLGMAYVQFANTKDAEQVVEGTDGRVPRVLVCDYLVNFEYVHPRLQDDGDWICNQARDRLRNREFKKVIERRKTKYKERLREVNR